MHDFYLYAVNSNGKIGNIDNSLYDFGKILSTGCILTRHSLGMIGCGFNGTDYISLSDYSKRFENAYKDDPRFSDYTAYELYSKTAVSLMIDKSKDKAKQLKLIRPIEDSIKSYLIFVASSWDILHGLMTDLPDEVQVRGAIGEEAFKGVTIPVKAIFENLSYQKLIEVYKKVKELIEKYEYHMGIYDVETLKPLEEERDLETIIKRSH